MNTHRPTLGTPWQSSATGWHEALTHPWSLSDVDVDGPRFAPDGSHHTPSVMRISGTSRAPAGGQGTRSRDHEVVVVVKGMGVGGALGVVVVGVVVVGVAAKPQRGWRRSRTKPG